MAFLSLMMLVSVAAGAVSAGYGGRGVIPSAVDLSPSDAAEGGPAVVTGGATSWVPSKGVRPPPRPIIFPGSTGQIDPGFAPKPWNRPGWTPGAQPLPGGAAIGGGGGGPTLVPSGKPFRGGGGYGYRGGVFHGGRPSYVDTPIYGTDGSVVGGGDGVSVSGAGIGGKPFSGVGGIEGKPVLEPVGGVVKQIDGIGGKPLDVPVGGTGHGGVLEPLGGINGKPVAVPVGDDGIAYNPLGSEAVVGSVGDGGVLVKPGSGTVHGEGFGGRPAVSPVGGTGFGGAVKEGSDKGGFENSAGGGLSSFGAVYSGGAGVKPIGGGGGVKGVAVDGTGLGPIGDVKPGFVPARGGGVFDGGVSGGSGVSHFGGGYGGGAAAVKPGILPGIGKDGIVIDGAGVGPGVGPGVGGGNAGGHGIGPSKGSVHGGGLGDLDIDDAGVKPSGGGYDGSLILKPDLGPIQGGEGGIDGFTVEGGSTGPVKAGIDGDGAVSGGFLGGGTKGGGIGGIRPVGGGAYAGGAGFGHLAGKPVLEPGTIGGDKGTVLVAGEGHGPDSGFGPIDESGAHGLGPTDGAGEDVAGGGVVIDTVETLGGGGATVLGPSGGTSDISGGGFGGTGLSGFGGKPLDGSLQPGGGPFGGLQPGVIYGGGSAGGIKTKFESFGTGGHKPFLPFSGGSSVGGIEPDISPFGTGGQKPFLPVAGDRAVGEVHPGFEPVGAVDGAVGGAGLGGTGFGAGTPVEKPVAGGTINIPYKPPRRYGR